MSEFYPKLCGSSFFCLLVANKKKKVQEPTLMLNFIKIFDQSTFNPGETAKQNTTQFKKGNIDGSGWIEFNKKEYNDKVNEAFFNSYYEYLNRIQRFIQDNIDSDHRMTLGRQLLELIIQDNSILETEALYLDSNNTTITKAEILNNKRYQLQTIFFGIWKYVINKKIPNSEGIKTYESWFKSEGPNTKPEFISDIGKNQCKELLIQYTDIDANNTTIPIVTDNDKDYCFDTYLSKIKDFYSKVKTLLYEYQPHDFDTLFECSDIIEKAYYNDNINRKITNSTHRKLYNTVGNNKLLLTGTGGIGKSMMMKNILLRAIEDYQQDNTNIIPIFIALKDYNSDNLDLKDLIFKAYTSFDPISEEIFLRKLVNGKFLLLLDGLDEIKTCYVDSFYKALDLFIKKYSANFIIISSRPFESFIKLTTFTQLQIAPLLKYQSINLIKKLNFRPDNPEIKDNFIKDLDNKIYQSHNEFASNPLLLTIMLMTYEEIAEIPEKIHIFYDEAFSALAKRHDATKGAFKRVFQTGLTVEEIKVYISEFCARTYNEELFEFSKDDIDTFLNLTKTSIKKNSTEIKTNFTTEQFITDLQIHLCLIYNENNKYHFIHRSIQEFFTALYFSKKPDNSMKNLINFFENRNNRQKTDMVFGMLTNMVPQKVEEYIYLPFLKEIMPDKITHENLPIVIENTYPTLYYTNCSAPSDDTNKTDSFFYEYITRRILKKDYPILTNMKSYSDTFIKNIKVDGKIIGSTNKMYASKLIDNNSKYEEFINQIEKCPLYSEYNELIKYKNNLINRIKRKASDIFD